MLTNTPTLKGETQRTPTTNQSLLADLREEPDSPRLDEQILLSVPVSIKRGGEWTETKRIMEKKGKLRIGEDTKFLSFRIDAEFSGALHLSAPALHIRRD